MELSFFRAHFKKEFSLCDIGLANDLLQPC